ncbi:hypothetical protein AVEN_111354-1 [Araneus ventricosus]|uniref:Uncharacterized protein n=1 Tax=Araneus ventricosus TaxID=182803 RepID=A0A4Y2NGA2_ARAVE|nr:hypothetical protein AVEN_111354-1 [Araneus ventricosus]
MERKFGDGVPVQVSFSSSDHGSKLRGPSPNSPRVCLKLDTNIVELNAVMRINAGMARRPPARWMAIFAALESSKMLDAVVMENASEAVDACCVEKSAVLMPLLKERYRK